MAPSLRIKASPSKEMIAGIDIERLCASLAENLNAYYQESRPFPETVQAPQGLKAEGRGMGAVGEIWAQVMASSAKLASPQMIGHMDTAPHPVAALSDAMIAATNNNLLFRELSPFASAVEELLVREFSTRIGWGGAGDGVFCSGGSIANLSALFAACGGFADVSGRDRIRLFVPAHAHTSIAKAAAVLGLQPNQICKIAGDAEGRMLPDALEDAIRNGGATASIVVANAGSTIHGVMDPLSEIAAITKKCGAWLHVDAIYGGAVMFSERHRHLLDGIEQADSVVLGPQKWMYVPRLSAVLLLRDKGRFDERLKMALPYSITGDEHRGQWGLQGSRRADAVTLWILLQVLGTDAIGQMIDQSIDLTRDFHDLLKAHPDVEPTHKPDLNVQCFRVPSLAGQDEEILRVDRDLMAMAGPWASVSRWNDELIFRTVLLPPRTDIPILEALIDNVSTSLTVKHKGLSLYLLSPD